VPELSNTLTEKQICISYNYRWTYKTCEGLASSRFIRCHIFAPLEMRMFPYGSSCSTFMKSRVARTAHRMEQTLILSNEISWKLWKIWKKYAYHKSDKKDMLLVSLTSQELVHSNILLRLIRECQNDSLAACRHQFIMWKIS